MVTFGLNVFQDTSESLSVLSIHIGCTLADGNVDTPKTHSSLDKHGEERLRTDIYTWPCTLIDSINITAASTLNAYRFSTTGGEGVDPSQIAKLKGLAFELQLMSGSVKKNLLHLHSVFHHVFQAKDVFIVSLSVQRVKSKWAFKGYWWYWCTEAFRFWRIKTHLMPYAVYCILISWEIVRALSTIRNHVAQKMCFQGARFWSPSLWSFFFFDIYIYMYVFQLIACRLPKNSQKIEHKVWNILCFMQRNSASFIIPPMITRF